MQGRNRGGAAKAPGSEDQWRRRLHEEESRKEGGKKAAKKAAKPAARKGAAKKKR